jgi:hypothetical protein
MVTKVVAVDTMCHWASSLNFMAAMDIVVVVLLISSSRQSQTFFSSLNFHPGSGAHPAFYAMQIVLLFWGKAAGAWR